MMKHVPFYPNEDGFHCINAAMQSVLRFYQRKNYSTAFLDCFLRRKPSAWPWMPECALALHELGLRIKYFAKINMMNYLKGESFIKEITGKASKSYTKRTDYEKLRRTVYKLEALGLFEQRELSLDEVSSFIKNKCAPIFVINNLFVQPRPRLGKYVVVTSIDQEHVYYHEAGPNYKVLKSEFRNAWFNTKELILVMGTQELNPIK